MKKKSKGKLRKPTLGQGDVHWINNVPKPQAKGKYACGKSIRRFKFTMQPSLIKCDGCIVQAHI